MAQSNIYEKERKSMSNLSEAMGAITKSISDYGNATLSKGITYAGLGGIGVGTANTAVHVTTQECAKYAPDWLAWAPLIGIASLAIKNVCDVYYKRLEVKLKIKEAAKHVSDETDHN